jgi:ActR/RegA family two-component response regulator
VKAPTRALIVEDIGTWVYTLTRAARRAGASEVVACPNLAAVRGALRAARFDVAILDVGLDPDDDLNADGVKALEAIREADGGSTRCVLVTGWQGGDRMALQSKAQLEHGVDWAYMKEKYEAHTLIAKLTELLEQAAERRLAQGTPMDNLSAKMDPPFLFESQLLNALEPRGGVQTLYSLVSRLLTTSIPVIARQPAAPLEKGPDGVCAGVYWSRSLASAVAVGLAPASTWTDDEGKMPAVLARQLPAEVSPDLIEEVRERNVAGRLWELPGLTREEFPG